jgi:hypothetical protein
MRSALILVAMLIGLPVQAQDPPKREDQPIRRWHLDINAVTAFPLSVGGRIGVESPDRIRISTMLGAIPEPYVAIPNGALVAAGAYDERIGELIVDVLGGSLVWHIQAGWRPFARYGWYVDVGYGLATLGGSPTLEEVLALVTELPDELKADSGVRSYEIESTLHWVIAETGYEFYILDALLIRASLCFAATVASRTEGTLGFEGFDERNAVIQAFVADAEKGIDELYTDYFFIPTFLLSVGYRIGGPEVEE